MCVESLSFHTIQDKLRAFNDFVHKMAENDPLSNHIVSGVLKPTEALVLPGCWYMTEVLGQEHVIGFRMNFVHAGSLPDLKTSFLFDGLCRRPEQALAPIVEATC